jgi:RsmE family RNA methyltransferase
MNLILLEPADFLDETTVILRDRRARHLIEVLHSEPGDRVRVGRLNGLLGHGRVMERVEGAVTLTIDLNQEIPRPRVSVILAMVRPQVMKRTLEHLTTLGVRRILLIGANRVERGYFGQRLFDGDGYQEHLKLGLEQARDTWLPEVSIHRAFKPFVEDVLPPLLTPGSVKLVAHPTGPERAMGPLPPEGEVFLAIGPEAGWIDYEVSRFSDLGFEPLCFGRRILRVETAIPYLFGMLALS